MWRKYKTEFIDRFINHETNDMTLFQIRENSAVQEDRHNNYVVHCISPLLLKVIVSVGAVGAIGPKVQ